MAKVAPIALEADELECLNIVWKKGSDWRERDRAKTILLLSSGKSVQNVAEEQGLCLEAVRVRRRKWLKLGLSSLPDQPRCGAPSKLDEKQREQLKKWMEMEPLCTRELMTRLERTFLVRISHTTMRTEIKHLGFVWKRTRYSLKKNGIQLDLNGRKKNS